ncbi:hypothetical protein [Thermophilibacter provencensis]|uniref:DUF5105 domain-containing protein n=1 Tax=Thermophilibacter provencensis TaxID=1852386 RepID=A0A921GD44_9ACTN|nr:hypothetical protein [Thermophilibacter provencensis]MBM6814563.1 hypothetical protein [Olsenella uli]HJF44565.1 hypothetical protein [Thermophilibacter provencensis]
MMNRVLKVLTCSITAVLALSVGLVLGACSGPSPEEAIREDLTANLDRVKELDDATVEELVGSMGTLGLETYGIEASDVVRSLLDGFDYTIDDITVDDEGTSAVASVSVTCKSASDFTERINQAATDLATELMNDPSGLELLSDEDALNARIGEVVMETLDEVELQQTSIEIDYSKTDDGWTASDASELAQIFS